MEMSIAKNAIFNMIYKAMSVIFPVLIVSYASRKLGASGIGEVSSAQNIVTYFTMIAALGIPSYGVRSIAQTKHNKEICNKTFTELFVINLCSSIVCTLLYFILLNGMNLPITKLNYIFASLIILNICNVEWVYEGFEKYPFIAIRSFIVKGISLLLMFIFVRNKTDTVAYAIIVCFGTVGNYILNIVNLPSYVHLTFESLEVKKHLRSIVMFMGAVVAIEIYSLVDITMLTYATTPDVVGYYSNASKIVKMLANTITALGAVMLPRLSLFFIEGRIKDIKDIVNNFLNVTLTIAVPATIGISFVSKEMVLLLFGQEFMPSISTIVILSPLIIMMPMSGGVLGQILLTSENEKKYLLCVSSGAMINCLLNFIFIPLLSHNGAAVASTLTEALVNIIMIYFSCRIIHLEIEGREIYKILCAAFIMGTVLMGLHYICHNMNIFCALIIKIMIAGFTYILCLLLMKQNIVTKIWKRLLN